MIRVGLTGGIASGKSTLLAMAAQMGAATHDADRAVHALLRDNPEVAQQIHGAFPSIPAILPVDRAALGALVFSAQDDAVARLEAILHPRVQAMETTFLRRARSAGYRLAVSDVPLLFEIGAEARYDAVITAICPSFLQKSRALARPGMTHERLAQRMARQMPAHEKLKRTDFVVHTGLGQAYSYRQLRHIFNRLRQQCVK